MPPKRLFLTPALRFIVDLEALPPATYYSCGDNVPVQANFGCTFSITSLHQNVIQSITLSKVKQRFQKYFPKIFVLKVFLLIDR